MSGLRHDSFRRKLPGSGLLERKAILGSKLDRRENGEPIYQVFRARGRKKTVKHRGSGHLSGRGGGGGANGARGRMKGEFHVGGQKPVLRKGLNGGGSATFGQKIGFVNGKKRE